MPRETRAVYVRQQRFFNRGHADNIYIGEWMQKSNAQKTAWLNQLDAIEQREQVKNGAVLAWNQAWVQYQGIQHMDRLYGSDFRRFHTVASNAANGLVQAYRSLGREYNQFYQLGQAQPGTSPEEVNFATANVLRSINAIQNLQPQRAALRAARNGPITPPDQSGCRRMPAHWFPRSPREWIRNVIPNSGSVVDLQTNNVALQQPGIYEWRPFLSIGGGMSSGCLWLAFDRYGVVQDRVFRKDISMYDREWTDPRRWEGDVRNPRRKIPYELTCNDDLQQIGLPYVARLRGGLHSGLINNAHLEYKVYVEWCPYKDLVGFVGLYRGALNNDIPEPMIWWIAEAMAVAGLAMREGQVAPDNHVPVAGATPGWEQIVHRDIKPGNIFLDSCGGSLYPEYPKPVLGDFGLSFKTKPVDPNNPFFYNNNWGTEGFKAPEQFPWIDQMTLEPMMQGWRVDSKTDVFAVGMLLRCLILKLQVDRQPYFLGNGDTNTDLSMIAPPLATAVQVNKYSIQLRGLIDDCLHFRPHNRISFRELLQDIRFYTDPHGLNLAEGMRDSSADLATINNNSLQYSLDTYQVGLSRHVPGALPAPAV